MIDKLENLMEEDERGVSPVLGVALLIGITVTLVAVVGIVVLGVGPSATVPSADFTFQEQSGDVVITHNGGDSLQNANVVIKTNGTTASPSTNFPTSINAGDSATLTGVSSDTTIKVVWNAPNSDKSVVLSQFTV